MGTRWEFLVERYVYGSFRTTRSTFIISLLTLWRPAKQGGVTNGNDLVAAYAKQSRHFPRAIAELGAELTDVGDRPQSYQVGQTRFTLGIVWIMLKAFFTPRPTKRD